MFSVVCCSECCNGGGRGPSVRPSPAWLAALSAEVMGSTSLSWYPTENEKGDCYMVLNRNGSTCD